MRLDTLPAHRQDADLIELRDGLHHALLSAQPDYMELSQAADWLVPIAHLLDPDGKPDRSGTQVQQELTAFLSDIDQQSQSSSRLGTRFPRRVHSRAATPSPIPCPF